MKTRIILSVFFSIFLINGIFGQVVNVCTNPSTTQPLANALLLDQEIWLSGGYPTFHYSGSSWTEEYTCNPQVISGVKNQSGQNVVYANGLYWDTVDDNNYFTQYKWNNVTKMWNVIPNLPNYLKCYANLNVVNDSCIYFLSNWGGHYYIDKYTGSSFVELYNDTITDIEYSVLYADNFRIIFAKCQPCVLFCYDIEQDTVTDLVSIPGISHIKDVKSANGSDFFILSTTSNLYKFNINNHTLEDIIICPENEQNWFNETMEVATTNRLIFLGGRKGIKKVWINNNGDPISEVIYSITNPEWALLSSSHYGSKVIFAGFLGDYNLMSGIHVVIDYTTGIVETSLPDINIYPNPSKDWIKINGITELSDVQIFDITDKLVLSQEYQVDDRIDISYLTPGMYILNIKNSEGEFNQKIIKQ